MCKCVSKCNCNITSLTKGEKGDTYSPGYKLYAAKASQEMTDDPTINLFKNELSGNVVWTRSSQGVYIGTLAGAFTLNKTSVIIGDGISSVYSDVRIYHTDINTVTIESKVIDLTANTRLLDDDLLSNTSIQIMVFN